MVSFRFQVGMEVLVQLGRHMGRQAYKKGVKRSWRGGGDSQRKLRAVEKANIKMEEENAMEVEE